MTLVGMLVVMFYLDWRFSLIGAVGRAAVVRDRLSVHAAHQAGGAGVKKKESELASVVQESISSVRVVKAFAQRGLRGAPPRSCRAARASSSALQARSVKARLAPLVDVIVAVGTGLVLWFGVRLVLDGPPDARARCSSSSSISGRCTSR